MRFLIQSGSYCMATVIDWSRLQDLYPSCSTCPQRRFHFTNFWNCTTFSKSFGADSWWREFRDVKINTAWFFVKCKFPNSYSVHPNRMKMPPANLWPFGVQPGLNQVIKADTAKDSTFPFLVVQVPFRKMEINKFSSNLQ